MEVLKEFRLRGEDQPVALGKCARVRFHGLQKLVEVARFLALVEGACINSRGLRVRATLNFLDGAIGFRLDGLQVALALTENARGIALALGTELLRNAYPLGNHPLEDLPLHA